MLIELIHITRNKNDIPLKLTKISPLLELNSSLPTHPLPLYPLKVVTLWDYEFGN